MELHQFRTGRSVGPQLNPHDDRSTRPAWGRRSDTFPHPRHPILLGFAIVAVLGSTGTGSAACAGGARNQQPDTVRSVIRTERDMFRVQAQGGQARLLLSVRLLNFTREDLVVRQCSGTGSALTRMEQMVNGRWTPIFEPVCLAELRPGIVVPPAGTYRDTTLLQDIPGVVPRWTPPRAPGQYRAVYLIFRTVSGNPSDPGTWSGELVPLPDRTSNAFIITP
jgi:hypothetical protein